MSGKFSNDLQTKLKDTMLNIECLKCFRFLIREQVQSAIANLIGLSCLLTSDHHSGRGL